MRRLLLLILVLTSSAGSIGAVGKVTVDPNVPGAASKAATQEDFWKADARLARKITYEARRKTVVTILADLQATTGVTLKGGYNNLDWQVRDRKMVIFAKDMALGDLMQSIARVMKFKWSRSGDEGAWSYRLYMDRRTVLESEGEAYRAEQRFNEEQTRKRESFLGKLGELSSASPEEIAKLRDENPYLYALYASGVAGGLDKALSQPGTMARDAFISNERRDMRLPEAADEALRQVVRGMWKMESGTWGESKPADLIDKISDFGIRFNREELSESGGMFSEPMIRRFLLGSITVSFTKPLGGDPGVRVADYVDIEIPDPDSSFAKGFGRMMASALDDTGVPPAATHGFSFSVKPEEFLTNDFGEPVAKHPDDPELQKEVERKADKDASTKDSAGHDQMDGFLAKLAEDSGRNVVSDCLGKAPAGWSHPVGVKIPLQKILDGIAMIWSYNWWSNGSTLEFRDRYWFRKRSLQIPEAYMEKWRQAFKSTGTLGLADLAEMAALAGDADKYGFNIEPDEVLGNQSMLDAVRWNRLPLRFYAALDSSQRAALLTKDGLDMDRLSSDQRESVEALGFSSKSAGSEAITLTEEKTSDGRTQYLFQGYLDGRTGMRYVITAPRYEPPKPTPKPKDDSKPASGK